jgi:hypothetical protein
MAFLAGGILASWRFAFAVALRRPRSGGAAVDPIVIELSSTTMTPRSGRLAFWLAATVSSCVAEPSPAHRTGDDDLTPDADDSPAAACRDGVRNGDEECDPGRSASPVPDFGVLPRTCRDEGYDGGTIAGCNADCTVATTACHRCGDGAINGSEACDGADLGGQTCADFGFVGSGLRCTGDCVLDPSACATCGNGVLDGSETCDLVGPGGAPDFGLMPPTCEELGFDGGTIDACAPNCTADTSSCHRCGDGTKNGTEACDGDDLGGATCEDLGYAGTGLRCSACNFDLSGCSLCGNGRRDPNEACDPGDTLDGNPPPDGGEPARCDELGFDDGTIDGCNPDCTWNTSGCYRCGDHTKNGFEDCDGDDLGGADCRSRGFWDGVLECDASCRYVTSLCDDCGDGNRDAGEECDGDDFGGATCESLTYAGGNLQCDANCHFYTGTCTPPPCGDGIKNGSEECDLNDFGGATCASLNLPYPDGALSCTESCTLDGSACGGCGRGCDCQGGNCTGGSCARECRTDANCCPPLHCLFSCNTH